MFEDITARRLRRIRDYGQLLRLQQRLRSRLVGRSLTSSRRSISASALLECHVRIEQGDLQGCLESVEAVLERFPGNAKALRSTRAMLFVNGNAAAAG